MAYPLHCAALSGAQAETGDGQGQAWRDVRAWTSFWREQGPHSHCLRLGGDAVGSTLRRHWETLACGLAAQERVIDIGCGSGIVGRIMLATRPDLSIAGIDSANIRFGGAPGLAIHGGVEMEALAFPPASFGWAVSQFGFEYGDPHRAAPELARVLRPGGRLSLVVHHRESAIVATNAARRSALHEIAAPPLRDAFLSGDRAGLTAMVAALVLKHGDVDLVRQIAAALPQRVDLEGGARSGMWRAIGEALAPEAVILDSLLEVCQSRQSILGWLAPLRAALADVTAEPIRTAGGAPVAWHVSGRRV